MKRFLLLAFSAILVMSAWFWTGLVSEPFEETEILKIAGTEVTDTVNGWIVILNLENVGTLNIRLSYIEVNGTWLDRNSGQTNGDGVLILSRETVDIWIELSNNKFFSGCTVEVVLHTTNGKDFIHLVSLPLASD